MSTPATVDSVPVLEADRGIRPDAAGNGGRAPRRARVFVSVLIVATAVALVANWARPAVYRSTATLLVEAQTVAHSDTGGLRAEPAGAPYAQLLATERQRLLAAPLRRALAAEFGAELDGLEAARDPLVALETMLRVQADVATNLLDVAVEGHSAALLPRILERWLARYEEARAAQRSRTRSADERTAREQLAALDEKIATQRSEIDAFRSAHGIVSEERTENAHAAQLKGLNDSLNKAADDELRAAARLAALRAAAAAGEPVADDQNLAAIERQRDKIAVLRDTVRAQRDQYTEKYARIAPEIGAARKDLEQAENDLVALREQAAREAIAKAEQDLATARDAKAGLLRQRDALKGELSEFARRFDQLGALRARLAELEAQAAPLRERLLSVELAGADPEVRVSVLAPPSQPARRISPDYARDALFAVGAAFLTALFATWLVEFLARPAPRDPAAPQIYSLHTQLFPPVDPPLASPALTAPLREIAPPALPSPTLRELAPAEVAALLAAGDDRLRLLVALLLCGADADEILELRGAALDERGMLTLTTRSLTPAPGVDRLWRRVATNAHGRLFVTAAGATTPTRTDLDGMLFCLAHDAGLAHPEEVTAQALRHTLFAWLVRRGVKLGELVRVGGALDPAVVASYARFAAPGAGHSLEEIDVRYPALAALERE